MEIYNEMYLTEKPDGPSIEKYIAHYKLVYPLLWRFMVKYRLLEDAKTWWWNLVNHDRVYMLQDEEFEQFFFLKWSRAKKKDNESPNSLFSFKVHRGVHTESLTDIRLDAMKQDNTNTNGLSLGGISLLQVHGCIQQEKVIVSIKPSCKHNYINVDLTHRLKVLTNSICSTQVDGEHVQVFKDLKITMDKYVLHYDFHAIDMDNVDVVLGYPWMQSVGAINLNV
jgi:hypothetical protein